MLGARLKSVELFKRCFMSKTNFTTWSNSKYPNCKQHVADSKWPTVEGGVCFKLSSRDGKCNHYFDNWQQAYALGWRMDVPAAEVTRQKQKD